MNRSIVCGLLLGLFGSMFYFVPSGQYMEEELGLATLFRVRGPEMPPDDVIIVSIDKESSQKIRLSDEPEKWPRLFHAYLIFILQKQRNSLTAFNIVFDEQRNTQQDRAMAEVMAEANNVVLTDYLKRETLEIERGDDDGETLVSVDAIIPPIPMFQQSALASAPFPLPKGERNAKRFWTFLRGDNEIPTFPVSVFELYVVKKAYPELVSWVLETSPELSFLAPDHPRVQFEAERVHEFLAVLRNLSWKNPHLFKQFSSTLGRMPFSSDKMRLFNALLALYKGSRTRYLNHYGGSRQIKTIPYHLLFNPQLPSTVFKNKVVFVGFSEDLQPEKNQGFYSVFSQDDNSNISTVELAATAFSNILENSTLTTLTPQQQVLWVFIWGFALGGLARALAIRHAIATLAVVAIGYWIFLFSAFDYFNQWYPTVVPLCVQVPGAMFIALFCHYTKTKRERDHIQIAFGRYLPDTMVEIVARQWRDCDLREQDELLDGVCLATDAGKYTTLSETLNPRELKHLLDRYYSAIIPSVVRHNGIVSDVIGDALLAIWTLQDKQSVASTCEAALTIQAAVSGFNHSQPHQLPTRMGLHFGPMCIGNLGNPDHLEYRAVGDVVNTATRIEGINKQLGTSILISDEIARRCTGFVTRELGTFLLEGKTIPIVLHELICRNHEASSRIEHLCLLFEKALRAFRHRSMEDAREYFSDLLRDFPDDGPGKFYMRTYFPSEPPRASESTGNVVYLPKSSKLVGM